MNAAAAPVVAAVDVRRRRGRLFRRYFLFIMALVCGALLASGGISLYASYQENKLALARLQKEKAIAAASRIEQFIKGIEQQLSFAALPQLGSEGAEQRRIEFLKLLRQAPAVTDITQLDARGQEVLAVSRLSMDTAGGSKDRAGDPAFVNAKPGKPWIGPVYFRKETEPYFSVGLRAGGGVTVAEVNLKFVWDVVSRIRVGEKGKAYVVDAKGQLVADPDIGLVLRKTDLSALEQVKAALGGKGEDEPALIARSQSGIEVLTAWSPIETLGWEVFVEQPVSEVYATLNASIVRTGLLLLIGLAVSAIVSTFLARSMVRPIRVLQEGAQRIGEGELEQRIEVATGDELETLAEQFNQMTAQLRESYAGLERKVEERTGELTESLQYQTAISEVLRVISESPTDVAPVFRTILECTQRLFDDPMTAVFLYDGSKVDMVATMNWSEEAIEDSRRIYPAPPNPSMMSGRVILGGKVVTIEDTLADAGYDQLTAASGHWRRMLGAPMIKDGATVGAIVVCWPDPGKTPLRQADLLKTFADQAVIAIENVRLINETKAALERQTATSEVLRVISRSVADAQPVFQAIADRTSKLFGGESVGLLLVNGDRLELAGAAGSGGSRHWDLEKDVDMIRQFFPKPLNRETSSGVAVLERRIVEIADVEAPEILEAMPNLIPLMRALKYRSELCVPMMRGGEAIGTISVNRGTPGAFKPSEVELLQTFADQAVIAIENARLFNETKAALERQTAIADILRAISDSVTDYKPILDVVVTRAAQICDARDAHVFLVDGERLVQAAAYGDLTRAEVPESISLVRGTAPGRAVLDRQVIHIPDLAALDDQEYPISRELHQKYGHRSLLSVPLMREGEALGVITMRRTEAGGFTEIQIALMRAFADQAAIAIANTRLFEEIQEKGRQLELANQHKSEFLANMSHELRTPLNAVIGFSEVLIEGMFGDLNEKQLDYVQDIHASGRHLLSLINDILDLSKIEAGRMELEVTTFDLPSAVGNAVTLVRERAQRHGIELKTEVDDDLGEYQGDERKFKQIMLNLLSNAVKFTGDGGRVTVAAHRNGAAIEVSVADTGIGIAPDDQPKVFEEFVQVGSNYATKREGTGLGLPLAKRFVELHGGRMWLTSVPGAGSTFFFSLPLKQEVAA